jgi:membrane-associated phospholipid phosphatase
MNNFQSAGIGSKFQTRFWNSTPYANAWIVIGIVVASDFVGLHLLDRTVVLVNASRNIAWISAIVLVIVWIRFRTRSVGNIETKWGMRLLDLANTGQWMIGLAAFCTAAGVLSHLSVAAHYPLVDEQLSRIDKAIGFDWVAWYQWVRRHSALLFFLNLAYNSGLPQTIVVPFVLGITGRRRELVNHVTRFMLAVLICIGIATLFPAASAFLHFHITDPGTSSSVSTFFPLRDGTLRVFDLADEQGLISMPSMHTAMAVLFAYAIRGIPVLGYAAMTLNAVMIASTPTQGGHYLIDVVAGALLALTTIILVKHLRTHDSSANAKTEA